MSSQVGVAQQSYDELDNLASLISPPESELNEEDDSTTSEVGFQNGKVFIDCVVNTSPGTSEVCTSVYIFTCFVLGRLKATESLAMVPILPSHLHSWHCAGYCLCGTVFKTEKKERIIRG